MPTLHPTLEDLHGYLLGRLSLARLEEVASHLETCRQCEATVATLDGQADYLLAELAVPVGVAEFEHESELARVLDEAQRSFAGDSFATRPEMVVIRQLRDYQLLEKLGEGGMGAVYKARHARLKKLVAVKVLPAERMSDARAVARFQREMEAVGTLEHPHIVRALDAGEHEGTHYLVMEYVAGHDLSTIVRRLGPLSVTDACELVRQAAIGLQYAHEHGLVHRDIKPSNLMLCQSPSSPQSPSPNPQPLLKILDLGLALLDTSAEAGRELTGTGQMMGTLDYMAPEQGGDSHLVDIRADIYSLGATLYKLLTGEAPFAGGNRTHIQKLVALATEPPASIAARCPHIPADLAALIHRMLAKQPADRPSSPAEVAAALAPHCADSDLSRLLLLTSDHALDEPTIALGTHPGATSASVATSPVSPPLPLGEGANSSHHAPHYEMRATGQSSNSPAKPSAACGSLGEIRPNASPPALPHAEREAYNRRRTRLLALALGLTAAAILAGIIIVIRDNKGKVVGRVEVPEGQSYSVEKSDPPIEKLGTPATPAASDAPFVNKPIVVGKPLPIPKPVELDISPDPIHVQPGEPMLPTAYVLKPAKIEGLRSWTVVFREPDMGLVQLSPSGTSLVTIGRDGFLRVWNPMTKELRATIGAHTSDIQSASWHPAERYLATAGGDGCVRIWTVDPARLVRTMKLGSVNSVAWSPDGRWLAYNDQGAVWCLNPQTRKKLGPFPGRHLVFSVAWSPDSKSIAIGSSHANNDNEPFSANEQSIGLYNIDNTTASGSLGEGLGRVTCLAWSPNGRYLVSNSYRGGQVWDIETRDQVAKLPSAATRGPHRDRCSAIWSHDGRTIAYLENLTGFRLFDVASGTTGKIIGTPGEAYALSWVPKTRSLLCCTVAGHVDSYDASEQAEKAELIVKGIGWLKRTLHDQTTVIRGKENRGIIKEGDDLMVSADGHYVASDGVEKHLVYVALTEDGVFATFTPAEFATKYAWKNDPTQVKLLPE